MLVHFGQIYGVPSASFPFSYLFQRRLSEEITALVIPSDEFLELFGVDFELMFRVSAKPKILDNEIKGPTIFKKTKDVEFTIFLPFDVIMRYSDAPRHAVLYLLIGVCDVFDKLKIDKSSLLDKHDSIVEKICSDPTMLAAPSWDESQNKTAVRYAFQAFYDTSR